LWVDRSEAAVALRVVYAGVAAYAVLFVFATVLHYAAFHYARFDLGNMVQAVWSTLHGHPLETTGLGGHQHSRLGSHVDPFLILLAPLLWIWSSPVLLLVLQVLAVASGALPVFWLARKHLESPRAGAHFALAYLLYPATQATALTDPSSFHPVAFAVPLILFAVWFLDEDRLVAFSVCALLAATTKEEIPLAVGCLGIWYAVRKGRRMFGLGLFTVGLGITFFNFLWVIPHFSPTGGNPFAARYAAVGGTPEGMVEKLFTDPSAFVHAVATGHKVGYLALLLLPFLGLWALEPLLFLGALPDLAINLLSNRSTSLSAHWTEGIIPFIVAASVFGAARFKRNGTELSLWVLAAAGALAILSPLWVITQDLPALSSSAAAAKEHAVSLIPEGAPVSASNQLASHLSERRYIYMFPSSIGRARWIIVDRNDPTYHHLARFRGDVRTYESDTAWRVVFSSHGVVVLHKRPTS
jgi:uncharacterized membrane protein